MFLYCRPDVVEFSSVCSLQMLTSLTSSLFVKPSDCTLSGGRPTLLTLAGCHRSTRMSEGFPEAGILSTRTTTSPSPQ